MESMHYIEQVRYCLRDYPEEILQQISDDLFLYIEEQTHAGHTEDEILASLGSAKDYAESMRILYGDPGPARAQSGDFIGQIGDTFSEFTDWIRDGVKTFEKELRGDREAHPEPLDIAPQTHILTILCYHSSLSLTICPGSSLTCAFSSKHTLFGKATSRITAAEKHGGILIKITAANASSAKPASLVLEVPPQIDEIQITSRTGDTCIRNMRLSSLTGRFSHGQFLCENTRSDAVALQAGDAVVEMTRVTSDHCYIQTDNSEIRYDLCDADAELRSRHGLIRVSGHTGPSLTCMSSKGSQHIETAARSVSLESTSGKILVRMHFAFDSLSVKTRSGAVEACLPYSGWTAEVSTNTGNIKNMTDLPVWQRKKRSMIIGDGDASVRLLSASGSILCLPPSRTL